MDLEFLEEKRHNTPSNFNTTFHRKQYKLLLFHHPSHKISMTKSQQMKPISCNLIRNAHKLYGSYYINNIACFEQVRKTLLAVAVL